MIIIINYTLFVPPKEDFRRPLYYIRCINFLDPDYEIMKAQSKQVKKVRNYLKWIVLTLMKRQSKAECLLRQEKIS